MVAISELFAQRDYGDEGGAVSPERKTFETRYQETMYTYRGNTASQEAVIGGELKVIFGDYFSAIQGHLPPQIPIGQDLVLDVGSMSFQDEGQNAYLQTDRTWFDYRSSILAGVIKALAMQDRLERQK